MSPYEAFEHDEFGAWVLVCNPSYFEVDAL